MMTCKEVSTLMSTGSLDDASWRVRMAVRLHLSMCRHCRAFKRQLEALATVARTLSAADAAELPSDFEARFSESLRAPSRKRENR
jgi:predicted anti-sigma-YlaC factor YlaD